MPKFQLWSRDKYGQGNIFDTSENVEDLIKRAKKEVTDLNVNNALTQDDKERNWEAYFVDLSNGKKKTKYIYGSNTVSSPNTIYEINKDSVSSLKLEDLSLDIKIYLGNISASRKEEKDWFAKDPKGNLINSLSSPYLEDKTVFFIKKL